MYLKLVRPTAQYAEQVMRHKKDMLANQDSFDGCAGLEEVDAFSEWIDFEHRLKRKYGQEYVPSEVFLGVRIQDDKVVGIIDTHYHLFCSNMAGISAIVFCRRSVEKDMPVKC